MKDISIIIVNYNVQYFLDQCIQSIYKSKHELNLEIIVVDNNSQDGSIQMVKEKYPSVHLITNKNNPGFAVANNQAIDHAQGKYVLLLNPDTLLSEDALEVCYKKMENDKDIGALGIKMLDGKGNFLPESKRGFPDFWTAFYKMSGLSKLLPKSKTFNKYHLGHLDNNKNHEIEVLSGAFMFIRKSVLDKTGYLDEQFFMYGEDIDLSYRVLQAGYKNYYLADSSIVHFKGESTKKASVSYVKHFYNAMAIFNNKHSKGNSFLLKKFIGLAIFLSGILSFFKLKILPWIFPFLDAAMVFFAMFLTKEIWAKYYFNNEAYYNAIPLNQIFLGFSLIYIICLFINGHYDERATVGKMMKGWMYGGILSFITYSFLPEDFRFSRAIIFISFLLILILLWMLKRLRNRIENGSWNVVTTDDRRVLLVGAKESINKISQQFSHGNRGAKLIGVVSPESTFDQRIHLGGIDKISKIVQFEKPSEIIFCSGDISNSAIFRTMTELGEAYSYRISSADHENIIGSDSKNKSGIWYSTNLNFNISSVDKKRQKRVFDLVMSVVLIMIFPAVLIISKQRKLILSNLMYVLIGRKTWIGYLLPYNSSHLPNLKDWVFSHKQSELRGGKALGQNELNFEYAQNYDIWKDFVSLLFNLMP